MPLFFMLFLGSTAEPLEEAAQATGRSSPSPPQLAGAYHQEPLFSESQRLPKVAKYLRYINIRHQRMYGNTKVNEGALENYSESLYPESQVSRGGRERTGPDGRKRRERERESEREMAFCSCFGPSKAERLEAEHIQSQEARHRAAEAAQRRQEQFEKSAAGRAAIKQMAAMKQSNVSNKGEPVLKWQMG